MKHIKSLTGGVLYESKTDHQDIRSLLEEAVRSGADLSGPT